MAANPTRMELSKLQKRLRASREGHKLLKDKQNEFMRVFLNSYHEANKLREKVNREMKEYSGELGFAVSAFPPQTVQTMLVGKNTKAYANVLQRKWMGIPLMDLTCEVQDIQIPGAMTSSPQLIKTVRRMREILPDLINLTVATQNCTRIAAETEVLRRRVNALEHRVIPELESSIRTIKMKLSDGERDTITRLIKIKNMDGGR